MAATNKTERIEVTCNCGATLTAPKKAIGKKVKCPRCNKAFTVPNPGSSVDRMIYALSDDQYNKPALEEQPEPLPPQETEKGKLCPNCNAEMSRAAVFCVKCGFHIEHGATTGASSRTPSGIAGFFARLFKRK